MRGAWTSVILMVFSLSSGWEAYRMGLGHVQRPGPGFFPLLCSCGLALVSLVMFAQAYVKEPSPSFEVGDFKRILPVILGVSVFGLLIEYLGLGASVFLTLTFFWLAIERQRWIAGLTMAALSALFCYLIFDALLGVHFSRGILGF